MIAVSRPGADEQALAGGFAISAMAAAAVDQEPLPRELVLFGRQRAPAREHDAFASGVAVPGLQ